MYELFRIYFTSLFTLSQCGIFNEFPPSMAVGAAIKLSPGLTEAMWASIVATLVLPSTFVKDLVCVAWQSLLSITSLMTMVSVLIWYTVTHYSTINLTDVLFWDTEGALVALGLVISSYCVYSILIPVEETMADPSKFDSALGISLSLAATFKVLFSLCGFLSFSHATDEVIGNNFPLGAPRIIVSVVYVMYVIFSYTLVIFPVFQSIDGSRLASAVTSHIPFFIWSAITRFLVVFSTLFLAVVIPHFALLTAFVGSLALPFLEYIVPCLVHLKLKWQELKPLQVAADGTIVVMGALATVFGAYCSGKALVIEMTRQSVNWKRLILVLVFVFANSGTAVWVKTNGLRWLKKVSSTFQDTLNFRKFKVALNPIRRIFLNCAKSCILSCWLQFNNKKWGSPSSFLSYKR